MLGLKSDNHLEVLHLLLETASTSAHSHNLRLITRLALPLGVICTRFCICFVACTCRIPLMRFARRRAGSFTPALVAAVLTLVFCRLPTLYFVAKLGGDRVGSVLGLLQVTLERPSALFPCPRPHLISLTQNGHITTRKQVSSTNTTATGCYCNRQSLRLYRCGTPSTSIWHFNCACSICAELHSPFLHRS